MFSPKVHAFFPALLAPRKKESDPKYNVLIDLSDEPGVAFDPFKGVTVGSLVSYQGLIAGPRMITGEVLRVLRYPSDPTGPVRAIEVENLWSGSSDILNRFAAPERGFKVLKISPASAVSETRLSGSDELNPPQALEDAKKALNENHMLMCVLFNSLKKGDVVRFRQGRGASHFTYACVEGVDARATPMGPRGLRVVTLSQERFTLSVIQAMAWDLRKSSFTSPDLRALVNAPRQFAPGDPAALSSLRVGDVFQLPKAQKTLQRLEWDGNLTVHEVDRVTGIPEDLERLINIPMPNGVYTRIRFKPAPEWNYDHVFSVDYLLWESLGGIIVSRKASL